MITKSLLWISIALLNIGTAFAVGQFPVPQITDVSFTAEVTYDPVSRRFTYQYGIASGATNIGDLGMFFIDVTREGINYELIPSDFEFSVPVGKVPTFSKLERFKRLKKLPYGTTTETLHTDLPPFWSSGITRYGQLAISPPSGGVLLPDGSSSQGDRISPGESISGLTVVGLSPPGLREVILDPDWFLIVKNEEEAELVQAQADQILRDLPIRLTTIGPKAVNYTGHELHDRLVKDIDEMLLLGWITDLALINNVQALLAEAKTFLLNTDGTQAKVKYQQAIDLMAPVTETQMRREAIDLIRINLQLKLEFTRDTTIPEELVLIVEPTDSEFEIGQLASFTPKLVDRTRDDRVVSSFDSLF